MLQLRSPKRVKPIFGFIYNNESNYSKIKKILAKKYGKIDFESKRIDFNYTNYYCLEMGKPLFRRFISFLKLKDPSHFIKVKLFSVKIEKKFAKANRRTVNIDPGYIHQAKLVLTTTKDFFHRLYLGKGVYAEITLFYKDGRLQHLPTTFPDYRTSCYKDIFQQIRNIYIGQN